MRRTVGTAVFAGMIGVTLFGVFMTPVFFYVVRRLTERKAGLGPSLSTIRTAMSLRLKAAGGAK
jgi:multidrug efflux pump